MRVEELPAKGAASMNSAPLSDAIILAVAKLVDDAQSETREPSHSDIEFQIVQAGLSAADPKAQGQNVGKAKRVRATLSWALEQEPSAGEGVITESCGSGDGMKKAAYPSA